MSLRRPLRSVMLCNPRYLSAYVVGVAQAMGQLGHVHRQVSIWDELGHIEKQIAEMAPDVIWTHTVAWPPDGAAPAADMLSILGRWKRRGTCVFLHDGDPKQKPVGADLIEDAFSIALVNRAVEPAPWPIPSLHWPYAAMTQREIGEPVEAWRCDLLFAGHLRREQEGYGDRTRLVYQLAQRLGHPRMRIVSPGGGDVNNRMLAADVAPSAVAVLGYGRPDVKGWIDTRVFQWPGAGGVLIHDDAGGTLAPDEHFIQFNPREGAASVLWALERAREKGPEIRGRAFAHIQRHHTWRNRVEQALAPWGLA